MQTKVKLHEAIHTNNIALVTQLVAACHDTNETDQSGYTPLHWASQEGLVSIATLLIEAHADVTILTQQGLSALELAVRYGHVEVAKLLVHAGSDIHRSHEGFSLLHAAAANGHRNVIAFLCDIGLAINATDAIGRTPLHLSLIHI